MSQNCCDWGCDQSPGCAAYTTPLPALDLPAPAYCERAKQNCNTPYTCGSLCRLITANPDGSDRDGLPVQMFEPRRWYKRPPSLYVFAIAGALIGFGLALYQTFLT